MADIRLLGLPGSLRKQAFSTGLLSALAGALPSGVSLELFPLHAVPLYNQDDDPTYHEGAQMQAPGAVGALRDAISACDGIIVSSPEYNYGMSGVLKNALDWASRPGYASPLKGKPVLIMTSSPGITGGVRAQAQLRDTFAATLSRVVACPQVVVTNVREKIADGRIADEATLKFVLGAVDQLCAEVRLLSAR